MLSLLARVDEYFSNHVSPSFQPMDPFDGDLEYPPYHTAKHFENCAAHARELNDPIGAKLAEDIRDLPTDTHRAALAHVYCALVLWKSLPAPRTLDDLRQIAEEKAQAAGPEAVDELEEFRAQFGA